MATSPSHARQFGDVFSKVIVHKSVINMGSAADSGFAAANVDVPGAAIGDFCMVSVNEDLVDCVLSASVTAANVVTIVVQNDSGNALDLSAAAVYRLVVLQPNPSAFL
jgi:hypothetical protein